jgi:hypothetical protein
VKAEKPAQYVVRSQRTERGIISLKVIAVLVMERKRGRMWWTVDK